MKRKAIKWGEIKEIKPASPGGFKLMRAIFKNGKKMTKLMAVSMKYTKVY